MNNLDNLDKLGKFIGKWMLIIPSVLVLGAFAVGCNSDSVDNSGALSIPLPTETKPILLPPGEKLVTCSWSGPSLYFLTRPRLATEGLTTNTFRGVSPFENRPYVWVIIFIETK